MQPNEILTQWADRIPDKVFLYFRDMELTYGRLQENVNRVANAFSEMGVKEGDRIALYLRNGPEFLYCWFGLNKIGAAMVPVNTAFRREETTFVVNDSGSRGIVAEADVMENLILPILSDCPNVQWCVSTGSESQKGVKPFAELLEGEARLETRRFPDDALAAILYTSGTTGNPKGVMCPHSYYEAFSRTNAEIMQVEPEDRWMTLLPLFHMNAQCTTTVGSLAAGASTIYLDGFDPAQFWPNAVRYQATLFNYLGSILPILYRLPPAPEEKEHSIRLFIGAQADPQMIPEYERRWGVRILELYGMTEIGGAVNPMDAPRLGSCGKAMPGHEIKIRDDQGKELPAGEVGEITMRGESMTLGYWQNPEATNAAYKDGWLYSGDLGYLDADGYLYFVDRKKDVIRRSGENISSAELEKVVMSHPGVLDAAAIPVPDPIRDEEVKIYVVLRQGETRESVPPEEIIEWCRERLAKFKVPRYIEYRDDLPRTATQKVQKGVLKKEKDDLAQGAWDRFADRQ
jgi:acyl-coenzyme A synthetase/AMP-(fatty) acid ligase